jgi:mRNA interferase RelE/StbE
LAWTANFDSRALKELEKLDRMAQGRIVNFLQERVLRGTDPRDLGKAMTGDKAGLWRYRVGDYRLVCHIDDDAELILVLRLGHRKEAYR